MFSIEFPFLPFLLGIFRGQSSNSGVEWYTKLRFKGEFILCLKMAL